MSARPGVGVLASLACLIALVAACASTPTGSGWTYGPSLASGSAPSASSTTGSPEPSASGSASASIAPSSSPSTSAADATWKLVGAKPCPESRFECITLAVPKDHRVATSGPTWDVTFAIQRAAKTRIGTFVVITGGPGSSGISSADSYTDYYATSITDAYDIVFIDQRGIGLSGPIGCVDAAAAFYGSAARPQVPAERTAAAAAAKTFVADCLAESGVAEADLPFYATTQAVEDLEAIRDYLDVQKLHLYGESYGTQYVQYYAAAHPDRIAALFVDGPVDLTLDGPTYYVEATRSADDTLIATLAACTAEPTCAADVRGNDTLASYDALAERLTAAPVTFDFVSASGSTQSRELTIADLENAAFGYIYSRADRALLQRAIAAASNDNLVPLARLAYDSIGIDPETLEAEEDPTWSDALYYAVECLDYAFFPNTGDPDARLTAWVDKAESAGIHGARLETTYYGDLPCLYWPGAASTETRPAPLLDPPYPVFVLTSTTDPATPIANGMRIYSRLNDAWFFQTVGGPHIIFAWGEPCPDDIISAYLADGTLPAVRVTTCAGTVATEYVPIPAATADGYRDALDLAGSIDDHIFNTDDYVNRFEADATLAIGCDLGGTLTYEPTDTGTDVALTACAFTSDLPLTGTGRADDEAGTFELDVTSQSLDLHYARNGDGARSVTGTFNGRTVDLKAPA